MSDVIYLTTQTQQVYLSTTTQAVRIIRTTNPVYISSLGKSGPQGIQGPPGDSSTWVVLTQAEYDAITPDPDTLYIIIN